MIAVLLKTLPFFAITFLGFAAVKWRLFEPAGISGISRFVMFLALPALLFTRLATASAELLLSGRFMLAYMLAVLLTFAGAALLARYVLRAPPPRAVLYGLAGTYGNIGFLGLPLITVLVGDELAVPLAMILTFDLVILVPLSSAALAAGRARTTGAVTGTKTGIGPGLAALMRNPLMLAIAAGALVSLARLPVPEPVLELSGLLSRAAAPCAMFVVGAVLAGGRTAAHPLPALVMSLIKLAVFPLVVWTVLSGFGIGGVWLQAAVLGAAMPVAAVVTILAEQHDVLPAQASMAVLISTLASAATIAVALTLV